MDRDQGPSLFALALAAVLLMGIFRPGGANTTVYIYDDNDATGGHAAGSPHTFAEIAAAFPGEFASLGTNANAPSYRGLQSIQIGDTGVGTATTTLTDTNSTVIWDNTKTLLSRTTQTTSWNLNLGTKVGSGNTASGKNGTLLVFGAATILRGNLAAYGCTFKTTSGALSWTSIAGCTIDFQNCLWQSSVAGVAPFVFGPTATSIVLYNQDFSHSTTSQVLSSFFATSAERITVCATSPSTFLQTAVATLSVKDLKLFGAPTTSDIRWSASGPVNWKLVRPGFTGNAPKFSGPGLVVALSAATWEYWLWDVKVVDGDGVGISGIPVKLTDSTGEVQVNTTTGSDGEVDFGSGLTEKAVKVMDHYMADATTYAQRHRSPFFAEINTGAAALLGYQSRRYYFNWPGYETITTSTGTFEDVNDIINLEDPTGAGGTNWTELVL